MGTNALRLLKQIELLYQEKHLPGRHNQKMHAPLKYLLGSGKVEIKYEDRYDRSSYARMEPGEVERRVKVAMKKANLSEKDIQRMVSLKGLNAAVSIRSGSIEFGDGLSIDVNYTDSDGKSAGHMMRDYGRSGIDLWAHNDLLELGNDHSMQGLATTLYANQIMTLKARGYKAIKTFADIAIGRYAWARKGFDYENPDDISSKRIRFHNFVKEHGIEEPAGGWPIFEHAKEFADFSIPGVKIPRQDLSLNKDTVAVLKGDSFEIGKAFMLDGRTGHGSWEAILRLQE